VADWLREGDIYLERSDESPVRPARPIVQGDVFADIPVSLYRKFPPRRPGEHPTAAKEQTVVLYGHPCTSRRGEARDLEQVQTVAVVGRAESLLGNREWAYPWPKNFRFFPLPGLINGEDYLADFGQLGVTRSEYLTDKRIACLNESAFASFQGRCATAVSRIELPLEEHERRIRPLWVEIGLWERWTEVTGATDGFQAWLDEPSRSREGASRREILAFAEDEVRDEMEADLEGHQKT
jgi:hypothetical protein